MSPSLELEFSHAGLLYWVETAPRDTWVFYRGRVGQDIGEEISNATYIEAWVARGRDLGRSECESMRRLHDLFADWTRARGGTEHDDVIQDQLDDQRFEDERERDRERMGW